MRRIVLASYAVLALSCLAVAQPQRWSAQKATTWYARQPWLVGSNYIPADAGNQLEMWQAQTFDPQQIDKELGWAEGLGMNTMRVFLHDLLWEQDPEGFKKRIDQFLTIAARHHIRPMLVLFDSCWDPRPSLGTQRNPTPGIHNSTWVQSPGAQALDDRSQYPRLKRYIQGVVGAFANDPRILAWDVWNEPDNSGGGNYATQPGKTNEVAALLPQVFQWARAMHPIQPLTSGVWDGKWSRASRLNPIQRTQLTQSDIITFHNYSGPQQFLERVLWLAQYDRPIICTEYMARTAGSRFENILPIAKQFKVGAINWGFVKGRTQTYLPWDSWKKPYVASEPPEWFHDMLRPDGTPYKQSEANLIRELTGVTKASAAR